MKCPNCRTKVPKNYMYCPKCGLSVKAARASEQRRKNVILMGVLALNISACFLIFRCISLRKPASKPNVTAEISSQAETTAAPAAETTAPPETEAELRQFLIPVPLPAIPPMYLEALRSDLAQQFRMLPFEIPEMPPQ